VATFRVWAPQAGRVELEVAGRRLPMVREAGGWYALTQSAPAGTDYGFRLDGGGLLPDPRSPWQPAGVGGPSRTVDHGAFAWSDQGWPGRSLEGAVIYEIHTGTFTTEGTFEAVASHLDHLAELGVTHIELMPVAGFVGSRGWGYDGVYLYAPHHVYGGPEGLKRLVDACHRRGLGVILDVVYNHLGQEGNHLLDFAPYLRADRPTDWGRGFDVDGPSAPAVRDFLIENALMWLRDYHLDGLRLDAADQIHDASPPHLLVEMSERVGELAARLGRRLLLVAETDRNDPISVTPLADGGWGLDAQWLDDFQHALHALVTGERQGYYQDYGTVADLATSWREAYVYSGRFSRFHDAPRGRPAGDVDGNQFVAFAQNHDQVGNRARGERLSQIVDVGRQRLSVALVLMSPYVPLLFMGEEWGASTPFLFFAQHSSQELREATRQGRRKDLQRFGWDVDELPDPEHPRTFEASRLDWTELQREPHRSLLAWYQQLIRLRRSTPELVDGRRDLVRISPDDSAGRLEIVRGPVRLDCDFRSGLVELYQPKRR
jgi:maltooligosyltrehalose trehalohydrolase